MKTIKKFLISIFIICGLIITWIWIEKNDFFRTNYNDLTSEQEKIFKWQDNDDENKLKERFIKNFTNKEFLFPSENVKKVKLFKNISIIGTLTSKNLKQSKISYFIDFCNNPSNFDWDETTWETSESEYIVRLYDGNENVIGKIFFCLKDCGMTSSRPTNPSMKFGGLTNNAKNEIENFFNNNENWE